MARTSRTGAATNVEALDNIDLDDMFAGDDDDMFGDLGIDDLDMDFTTGESAMQDKSESSRQRASPPAAGAIDPSAATGESSTTASTRSRRKTTRTTRPPAMYEDGDDDDSVEAPPPKRKRKGSPKKTKGQTKKPAQDSKASTGLPTSKAKAKSKLPLQNPLPRGTMTAGTVAAAGIFGGRQQKGQKRGAAFSLTKQTSKLQKLPLARGTSDNASKLKNKAQHTPSMAAANFAQIKSTHPGLTQSSYCGLPPSSTLFYPFMPALPTEPAMKSRKVYAVVDRVHTSFTSRLQAPPPSGQTATADQIVPAKKVESIVKLTQEAFKEDTAARPPSSAAANAPTSTPAESQEQNRMESVCHAVGAMRKIIRGFDKVKLAVDWHAVCALLQRQHDFLTQNAQNMELWCKNHFTDEDYDAVYVVDSRNANKRKRDSTVLGSFSARMLKVKLSYHGMKDPKLNPLIALLPASYAQEESTTATEKTKPQAPKPKKRKIVPVEGSRQASSSTQGLSRPKQTTVPLSYENMTPDRRRRNVAEMLTRTARELESEYYGTLEVRRKAMDKKENDIRKVLEQDTANGVDSIHTTGMWKWLETSGYFGPIDASEVKRQLDSVRVPVSELKPHADHQKAAQAARPLLDTSASPPSFVSTLQSLLVEIDSANSESDDENDFDIDTSADVGDFSDNADLSLLTLNERAYIHLQSFGLAETLPFSNIRQKRSDSDKATEDHGEVKLSESHAGKPSFDQNGTGNVRPLQSSLQTKSYDPTPNDGGLNEIDATIEAMKADLRATNIINNRRIAFLETVTSTNGVSPLELKRKNDEEASIVAKCQQLLRKAKEMKMKTGKMSKNNDSLALPW